MALGSTKRGEAQVVVAESLPALEVVRVGLGLQPGSKALVGAVGPDKVKEALLLGAEDPGQAVPVVPVVADLAEQRQPAIARFIATGQDVDRAPHGGDGQLAGAKATLDLGGTHDQVEAGPIAPVDPTVLHVVHGDTVDHDGEVGLVESPDGHPRVAITSTLLGRIDARRGVEHEGQVPAGQLFLDLGGQDVGERDRGLAINGDVGCDDGLLENQGLEFDIQGAGRSGQVHFDRAGRVSDVAEGQFPFSGRHVEGVAAIDVGRRHEAAGLDIGPDEGVTGETVPDDAGDRAVLGVQAQGAQPEGQEQNENLLHERRVNQCLTAWWRVTLPSANCTSTR